MRKLALALAFSASTLVFAQHVNGFELPWMNASTAGSTFRTVDHKNKVIVYESYFLNCPYCNQNAPSVDDLADRWSNEPRVMVVDLGVDKSDSQYQQWINRHHPNHPVLKDANKTVTKQLGTTAYPSTYVVACTGEVMAQTVGAWGSGEEATIDAGIQKALKITCP